MKPFLCRIETRSGDESYDRFEVITSTNLNTATKKIGKNVDNDEFGLDTEDSVYGVAGQTATIIADVTPITEEELKVLKKFNIVCVIA